VSSNSKIQRYNVYPMLHFCRKFSSGVTTLSTLYLILNTLLQTSFGYISINSSMILTVSMATGSSQKDFSIDASYVLR